MKAAVTICLICGLGVLPSSSFGDERDQLSGEFAAVVRPFVTTYCAACHGGEAPEAKFDVSPYVSLDSVAADLGHWALVLKRLRAAEMPPEDAEQLPDDELRQRVIDWIERLRLHEANKHAGDPGPVLARRLSNAEYDYAIQDLTGVDMRPTREFPIDPANEAGFDNTGESLSMSPALLNKYLAAARRVADHLLLLPDGLDFAPYPAVIYSDRDKFCAQRIVDFYQQQPTDYADYFLAAWRFRHRSKLGMPEASLDDIAQAGGISVKYLETVWAILTDAETDSGPIAELRDQWNLLPLPNDEPAPTVERRLGTRVSKGELTLKEAVAMLDAVRGEPGSDPRQREQQVRTACEQLRELVAGKRKQFQLPPGKLPVRRLNPSTQPIILWLDRDIASKRRLGKLPEPDGTLATEQLRAAVARFCSVFPDAFVVSERGRMNLPPEQQNKGRLLSAGFHLQLGYFRDDAPLYDLILDGERQQQLDRMWRELDFITQAPLRQFSDYVYFERAEGNFLSSNEFGFAREDTDVTSESKLRRLAELYVAKAVEARFDDQVVRVIDAYFQDMSDKIRRLEQEFVDAEPSHLRALCSLAERAWQRPLADSERDALIEFYRSQKEQDRLTHEEAVRDTLVSVLMSPRFCYRVTESDPGADATPLADHELASRLSFFLWSSIPDAELLKHAEAGDLHAPQVLLEQTRRMSRDPRIRRLATEFGGNWLDFRQFEQHNGVNRERFPNFTDELRQAMYEEPIRFFTDLVQRNGSVLEFIDARHTIVNSQLAAHYGIPLDNSDSSQWVRVDDADQYGRGGLLPMSVFMTKNSPGLRTSPVKRGYWVVRRLLGEYIPAPPPEVPELPQDEAKLGELSLREVLAQHRESKSCAVCHQHFDSIGLVFEGYGPVGEARQRDLGDRPVDTSAEFPDGRVRDGLEGLRSYLGEKRQFDFIDNICRKLLSYALGRSLLLSDESTIATMKDRLAAGDHRFSNLLESIVTSPQFLTKRGRDYVD